MVQRIKAMQDEVKFLVVDADADSYYRDRDIVVASSLDDVQGITHISSSVETSRDDTGENKQDDAGQSNRMLPYTFFQHKENLSLQG